MTAGRAVAELVTEYIPTCIFYLHDVLRSAVFLELNVIFWWWGV